MDFYSKEQLANHNLVTPLHFQHTNVLFKGGALDAHCSAVPTPSSTGAITLRRINLLKSIENLKHQHLCEDDAMPQQENSSGQESVVSHQNVNKTNKPASPIRGEQTSVTCRKSPERFPALIQGPTKLSDQPNPIDSKTKQKAKTSYCRKVKGCGDDVHIASVATAALDVHISNGELMNVKQGEGHKLSLTSDTPFLLPQTAEFDEKTESYIGVSKLSKIVQGVSPYRPQSVVCHNDRSTPRDNGQSVLTVSFDDASFSPLQISAFMNSVHDTSHTNAEESENQRVTSLTSLDIQSNHHSIDDGNDVSIQIQTLQSANISHDCQLSQVKQNDDPRDDLLHNVEVIPPKQKTTQLQGKTRRQKQGNNGDTTQKPSGKPPKTRMYGDTTQKLSGKPPKTRMYGDSTQKLSGKPPKTRMYGDTTQKLSGKPPKTRMYGDTEKEPSGKPPKIHSNVDADCKETKKKKTLSKNISNNEGNINTSMKNVIDCFGKDKKSQSSSKLRNKNLNHLLIKTVDNKESAMQAADTQKMDLLTKKETKQTKRTHKRKDSTKLVNLEDQKPTDIRTTRYRSGRGISSVEAKGKENSGISVRVTRSQAKKLEPSGQAAGIDTKPGAKKERDKKLKGKPTKVVTASITPICGTHDNISQADKDNIVGTEIDKTAGTEIDKTAGTEIDKTAEDKKMEKIVPVLGWALRARKTVVTVALRKSTIEEALSASTNKKLAGGTQASANLHGKVTRASQRSVQTLSKYAVQLDTDHNTQWTSVLEKHRMCKLSELDKLEQMYDELSALDTVTDKLEQMYDELSALDTVTDKLEQMYDELSASSKKFVGVHLSIEGSLSNAVEEAEYMQARAFSISLRGTTRKWTPTEVEKFKNLCQEKGYPPHLIVVHGSLWINCGSPDSENLNNSRRRFVQELKRCEMLGLTKYIFHPGSSCGKELAEECINKVAESINMAHSETFFVKTVIENMATQGHTVGGTLEEIKAIIERVKDKSRVGVCLDTCHAHAAGYNLSTRKGYEKLMKDFDKIIGLKYLCAMHLNDSKGVMGSRRDRHENIGKGHIGVDCFKFLMNDSRLNNIPLILETPLNNYAKEIQALYQLEKL
ncbi:uncharacterized protein LOC131941343 [Physella acuta]|uniref:uncharacterized protein LOC131941343 n=1 Tax=Physella acuta TaxID=109671 RepID=UPI0027DABB72|nr:uncharacterized protein LOC131941343 [Physella acuta]XP_059156552.1 uncharacterized protein LOC131941343 [Physella acuta]